MPTSPTTPTPAPTPPDRADRATFSARATASFTHLKDSAIPQLAALATNAFDNATEAVNSATIALGAVATSGAVLWVSGTTYAIGNLVYSPANFANYRRKTSGAGTTDPSLDATNWAATYVPGSLVLLAYLTPTVAANVDFLSTFTSNYDNYLIVGQGLKPSVDDILQLKVAKVGAVDAGSGIFTGAIDGGSVNTPTNNHAISANVYTAGEGLTFFSMILNCNDASRVKLIKSEAVHSLAATPTWNIRAKSSAYVSANTLTGFRLTWSAASNFQAVGRVRVYGYNNS